MAGNTSSAGADEFQGLAPPGVIVTDIRLALGKPDYARRMCIDLARALSAVRVVDKRDTLLREPILGAILCV